MDSKIRFSTTGTWDTLYRTLSTYNPFRILTARFMFSSRRNKSSIFLACSSFLEMHTNLAAWLRARICVRAWVELGGFIWTTNWQLGKPRLSSGALVETTIWTNPSQIRWSTSPGSKATKSGIKLWKRDPLMQSLIWFVLASRCFAFWSDWALALGVLSRQETHFTRYGRVPPREHMRLKGRHKTFNHFLKQQIWPDSILTLLTRAASLIFKANARYSTSLKLGGARQVVCEMAGCSLSSDQNEDPSSSLTTHSVPGLFW